jgi:serine/threonine protein kinase
MANMGGPATGGALIHAATALLPPQSRDSLWQTAVRPSPAPCASMTVDDVHALPAGHQLNQYRIEAVIGRGGFGITYQAQDTVLRKLVAVKEYLPVEFAVRASDASVQPRARRLEQDYRWGLERFLDEARTLAHFRHPNLVPVLLFFEANGTAYMVMEFERGSSLADVLADSASRRALIPRLPALLDGLLSALVDVHAAGFLHRDIKPANIILRPDGTAVLVDFGSARHAIGQRSRTLTSIVTPRYAPIEQYALEGKQGPWSDLYGVAAVLYHLITSEAPPEAVNRVRDDPYKPLAGRVDVALPRPLLAAIDAALAPYPEQRPQSVAAFRALAGLGAPPAAPAAGPPDENAPTRVLGQPAPAAAAAAAGPESPGRDVAFRALRPEDRIMLRSPPRPAGMRWTGLALLLVAGLGAGAYYWNFGLPWRTKPAEVAVVTPPPTPPVVNPPTPPVTPPVTNPPTPPVTNPPTPPKDRKAEQEAAAKAALEKKRQQTINEINQAAMGARGQADRAIAAAERARQRAGAARIRAAEAGKVDLQGAERVQYGDGAVYTGQLVDGRRDGLGVVELPSGERQAGEWKDDRLNGLAVLTLPDGRRYEGEWKMQVRDGYGVLHLGDGDFVAGEQGPNGVNGYAVWRDRDGRERFGQWRDGRLEGPGVEVAGGAKYEGEFRGSVQHGKGVLVQPDGTRYHGLFADGKREGYGVEARGDNVRSGQWKAGGLSSSEQ